MLSRLKKKTVAVVIVWRTLARFDSRSSCVGELNDSGSMKALSGVASGHL